MSALRRLLGSPVGPSLIALVALVAAGFAVLALTWRGLAPRDRVADQLPFVISGGFGGLGLIAVATTVLVIQHRRIGEAHDHAELREVVAAAAAVLDAARRSGGTG